MKLLLIFLGSLSLVLQYQLWFGSNGYFHAIHLKNELAEQVKITEQLQHQNQLLADEIQHLKQDDEKIEEIARSHLGMVKKGETLYRVMQ